VVFLGGWPQLRALAFPLALLLLSVPVPAIVMTRITLPLQFVASAFAELALNGLHIPVLREGNVLVLSNATLQVAEACSGIRSLMSLVALALVIAKFSERRAAARAAIVAAAVPVAIAVNTFRVTVTAIGTSYFGPATAQGAVHEAVGMVMFLIALALLFACARAVAAIRQTPAVDLAR
jgi:exosortase